MPLYPTRAWGRAMKDQGSHRASDGRTVHTRTIRELMGHRDIKTTMRYAHFAPQHASRSILEAQKREAAELAELQAKNRTKESSDLVGAQQEAGNSLK